MENRTNRLVRQTVRLLPDVVLFVAGGALFLDDPLASALERILREDSSIGRYTAEIPDLLLPFVLLLSAYFLAARRVHIHRFGEDERSSFYLLGTVVLPLSFFVKHALKLLFGRIETRVWLRDPLTPGHQWFHSGEGYSGFPSGHMVVFAALAAACWLFFPRLGRASLLLLLALGAALIATNYHFLTDVVAGAYFGMAATAATAVFLEKNAFGKRV